jgi:hypothetical protein
LADQESDGQADSPSAQNKPSWIARRVSGMKRYREQHRTERYHESAADRASRSTARATWMIAVLTVATIGVGFSQYIIFNRQLDIMADDKRPWLGVNISLSRPVTLSDWNGTRQIQVDLKFDIKNYGESPATNITIESPLVLHPGNVRRAELDVPQEAACRKARSDADSNLIGGPPAFPANPITLEQSRGVPFPDQDTTLFAVLGCIDYTYALNRHGQTGFRMMLGMVKNNRVFGIPFIEGPIPEGLLADGFPKDPPHVASIQPGDLYFEPADTGNYAK